nr:hypothetical protein [Pseudonocardia sp. KRD291]
MAPPPRSAISAEETELEASRCGPVATSVYKRKATPTAIVTPLFATGAHIIGPGRPRACRIWLRIAKIP